MTKYFYLLLVIMISFLGTKAQDTTHLSRHQQLQQLLGMSTEQYSSYTNTLKKYDKRLTEKLNDKSIDKNTQAAAMNNVLSERNAYVQQSLTEDQRKKLFEFNRRGVPVSPREKNRDELKQRLAKRGILFMNDSTSVKH